MNSPMFRHEAIQSVNETLSSTVMDARIRRSGGLMAILVFVLALFFFSLFAQLSLGVSTSGVLRPVTQPIPIVAQRSGILTDVLTERSSMSVYEGQILARIRHFDIVTLRGRPNAQFTKLELETKRQDIMQRMLALDVSKELRSRKFENEADSLRQLSQQLEALIPIYQMETKRYRFELDQKRNLKEQGLVVNDDVSQLQQLLTNRELQLRENMVRLTELKLAYSENRRGQIETIDQIERELLSLRNILSEIELDLRTDAEIEAIDITAAADGLLIPKGYISGKAVTAGEILFEVSELESTYAIEVDVPADQIGDIDSSLPVKASLSAFPFYKYGFFDAQIDNTPELPNAPLNLQEDLSGGAMFRLVISPDESSFKEYSKGKSILPGMDVMVHIRKARVPIWRILLAPLLRYQTRLTG